MRTDYRYLEIKPGGTVLRVNLNRPERHNALILELIEELDWVLDEVSAREDLHFLVLSGNGRSFSAGADLNWFYSADELTHEQAVAQYKHLADLLLKLFRLPQITIAVARGNVFGGGIGLMAVCDFVMADLNTRFMFSEVKLGLLPATILPFVAKRLSVHNLRKWILTGSMFLAPEAADAGLVDVVSEEGKLEQTLSDFLNSFGAASPSAVKKAKMLVNKVISGEIGVNDTKVTSGILAEALLSADGQEGIKAFLEKRSPEWEKPQPQPFSKGKGILGSEGQ